MTTTAPPISCQPIPELARVFQIAMMAVQDPFIDAPASEDNTKALMAAFRGEVLAMADRGELTGFDVFESREIETFQCEAEHVMTNAGARMRVWFDCAGTPLAKYMTTEER